MTTRETDPNPSPRETHSPGLSVVGIGASAGGLAALRAFFATVPDQTGMTFVVVTHLSPDHESMLAELLQSQTAMPVRQVTRPVTMAADHVYVIAPGKGLLVSEDRLEPAEISRDLGCWLQIDTFFRSLARHQGNAAAVILSGTGSDGAVGIGHMKEQGGLILVQDPAEAEFDGMPRSAIATGLVDIVAPVTDLAVQLVAAKRTVAVLEVPTDPDDLSEAAAQTLAQILAHLFARTGHDFSGYKRGTILRRMARRMALARVETLTAYLHRLRQDGDETDALYGDVLIHVTEFFRDPEAWEALAAQVIPHLFEGKGSDDSVRVWTAGCATGEETYGLAMLLLEHAATLANPPQIQVFASDLGKTALDFARRGVYPEAIAANVSQERLNRFFVKENSHYRVRQDLRGRVIFASHNLLQDPPFSQLDLILCRNLLIYLQREVQERVLQSFHYALRSAGEDPAERGYLFLGSAETVEGVGDLFETVDKHHHFYRRSGESRRRPVLPNLPPLPLRHGPGKERAAAAKAATQHQLLLEELGLPSLLVDEAYTVLHLSETAGRFLKISGAFSRDVTRLVQAELQDELRHALHRAFAGEPLAHSRPVLVPREGVPHLVSILVRPSPDGSQALVLFLEEDAAPAQETADDPANVAGMAAQRHRAEGQLRSMDEDYETTVEELRVANEELQSTNEEYRSMLEELEASKEELQSMNEELHIVNDEHVQRLAEISQAHSDLQNLFAATEIATLFLDRELCVQRYTPRAAHLFNLMPPDQGRPISDLRTNLVYEGLETDAHHVLAHLTLVEREVEDDEGQCYLMGVRPYRTVKDHIEGVVVTFVDITAHKEAEEALRRNAARDAFRARLADVLRPLADPVAIQVEATRMLGEHLEASRVTYGEVNEDGSGAGVVADYCRPGIPSIAGWHRFDTFGAYVGETLNAGRTLAVGDVHEVAGLGAEEQAAYDDLQIRAYLAVPLVKGDRLAALLVVHEATPRVWGEDEVALVEEVAERTWDAVARAQAEEALRRSEARFRSAFAIDTVGVIFWDAEIRIRETNDAFLHMTGFDREGVLGRRWQELTPAEFHPESERAVAELDRRGESTPYEKQYYREDGSTWWGLFAARKISEEEAVEFVLDITESKQAQEALRQAQESLALALEAARMGTWDLDLTTNRAHTNARHSQLFGYSDPVKEWTGEGFEEHVLPEDRDKLAAAFQQARETGTFDVEVRVRWPDDSVHWIYARGRLYADATGAPQRIAGVTVETTERKEAQLAEMRQRIIRSQEGERRHLARELHDGPLQELVALTFELVRLEMDLEEEHQQTYAASIRTKLEMSIGRLRQVMITLRPPAVVDFGLADAIDWHVAELQQEQRQLAIETALTTERLDLSEEAILALYRIAQQALYNVVRHARAEHVWVRLQRDETGLVLTVVDDGVGFTVPDDLSELAKNRHLGIVGMLERADAINAQLIVQSQPGHGTKVQVTVRHAAG